MAACCSICVACSNGRKRSYWKPSGLRFKKAKKINHRDTETQRRVFSRTLCLLCVSVSLWFALLFSHAPQAFPRREGGIERNRVEREWTDVEREQRTDVEDDADDERDGAC